MQVYVSTGEHSCDLGIHIELGFSRLAGFAYSVSGEVFGDQRIVLRLHGNNDAPIASQIGSVFLSFWNQGAEFPVDLTNPSKGEMIAGRLRRVRAAMLA